MKVRSRPQIMSEFGAFSAMEGPRSPSQHHLSWRSWAVGPEWTCTWWTGLLCSCSSTTIRPVVRRLWSNDAISWTVSPSWLCKQNNATTSHEVSRNNKTDSRAGKLNASPWAVKKINSKCATKQLAVYQKRLNDEAKLLKGINHPNIVGEIPKL